MKKLALALVCLMGVAFFTSCDPENVVDNPEPIIKVMTNENYLADSTVIELDTPYEFGFTMTSNPETGVELSLFELFVDGELQDSDTIDAAEYDYEGIFTYSLTQREIIGGCIITGRVTDANNKSATASIYLKVNKEESLVATPFSWTRVGGIAHNPATGLEEFGLKWTENISRGFYAKIEPVEGATLFEVDDLNQWEEVTTATQKATLISRLNETSRPIEQFTGVQLNGYANGTPATRDFLLVSIYNENSFLIRVKNTSTVTRAEIWTIEGEWK